MIFSAEEWFSPFGIEKQGAVCCVFKNAFLHTQMDLGEHPGVAAYTSGSHSKVPVGKRPVRKRVNGCSGCYTEDAESMEQCT